MTKSADELSSMPVSIIKTPATQSQSEFSLANNNENSEQKSTGGGGGTSGTIGGNHHPEQQELMFQAQFNASAIQPPVASFSKDQLDKACNGKHH